jgi:prepilin-type N-terminal cleavage/methylation domain-containing protein
MAPSSREAIIRGSFIIDSAVKAPKTKLTMLASTDSIGPRSLTRNAYTLIELLAVMLIIVLATVAYETVRAKHGLGPAVAAAALAVLLGSSLIVAFYRWSWRRDARKLAHLRETYRTIYRVSSLPTATDSIVKPGGAEIRIGDYGWDAQPSRSDGLIHLQGLTVGWQVVWHAGFRPEQIERVANKTTSQYDLWTPYWAKPSPVPPCPYPIQERDTPTMGRAHHSGNYFENFPSEHYHSPKQHGN